MKAFCLWATICGSVAIGYGLWHWGGWPGIALFLGVEALNLFVGGLEREFSR